jgi:hypothetical protein
MSTKAKNTLNATAVIPLSETTIDLLQKMQLHHPIPEGAKYIAFLEDGDACFLESIEAGSRDLLFPHFAMITYYENMQVEFEE